MLLKKFLTLESPLEIFRVLPRIPLRPSVLGALQAGLLVLVASEACWILTTPGS